MPMIPPMNETTTQREQFSVALSCMSNNGARAKSLGRVDCPTAARERFARATWEPLGHGAEWSRYVTLTRITGDPRNPTREVIGVRKLD